jgi:4-phospho-D-threonate 3-dehydrogenase / 4-phospho-D-erythronate 3-dehydrogenase
MMKVPAIAITLGDPAGIGPEVALRAAMDPRVRACCRPLLIGSRAILQRVAVAIAVPMSDEVIDVAEAPIAAESVVVGTIAAAHGAASAAWVDHAIAGCRVGTYAAMVTGPIHKQAWHAAGIPFPGHTEMLADRCGVGGGEAMLMYHDELAVSLVTVHQRLTSVPADLDPQRILRIARQTAAIVERLRGKRPRMAVLGFNPHAGEGGLFGDEEAAIRPAIYELLQLGYDVDGPLPPDTAFTPAARKRYDAWICQYHDQGLIPFKALYFDQGVNVTLGLPIVRTSVDHGTAFDQAWRGTASHESMVSAILLAARIVGA